jgi:hypothetical protein
VRFTLPGAHRHWTLTPQANVEDSRPDFLLEANDMNVPAVAIFTDGRAYHATAAVNRLADDAAKRANLRDAGLVVLGVTIQDVTAEEGDTSSAPSWYNPDLAGNLMNVPFFQAPPEAYKSLGRGPVDWLLNWISQPNPDSVRAVARAVPMFLSAGAQPVQIADDVPLEQVGRAVLVGDHLPTGARRVFLHRAGSLASAIEMLPGMIVQVAAVLDDREEVLDDAHAGAWHSWLRLANTMALRDWPTVVTTTSLAAPTVSEGDDPTRNRPVGDWAHLYDDTITDDEKRLIGELARHEEIMLPEVGVEGPDGIALDISWPSLRIAVAFAHMPAEDRADLAGLGWHLVDPSPDKVLAMLARAARDTRGKH